MLSKGSEHFLSINIATRGVQSALVADLQPAPASRPQTIATATLPPPEISGKWIATKLVLGGIEIPPEDLADEQHFWTFDGDDWRYSFVVDGKRVVVRFKVALTDSEAVYLVDAKLWSGEARGKVVKGICSMDGETLRLCMADKPAIHRPTHFECPKGSELHLMELRRAEESPTSP